MASTADYFKAGQTVRYVNQYGQVMVGVIVGRYHQWLMIQRPEWPTVEAVNPENYQSFEVQQ